MQKRFLALSLLLTVFGTRAMENDDLETKKESAKTCLFDDFERIAGGTIDPDKPVDDLPVLDAFTRRVIDYEFSVGFKSNLDLLEHALGTYGLLVQKVVDIDMKNSYKTWPLWFDCCAEVERGCSMHSGFIENPKKDWDPSLFKGVTHDNVLEILECGLSKLDETEEVLSHLALLKEKFNKEKEKRQNDLKITMLCLKDQGYSGDLMQPIASMIVTGHADSFKQDNNGNEN